MSDFLMPSLGADMESGKIVEWLVKPGSTVKKGDVVAVVETHKGAFEIDVFQEGTITELCAKEGEELPVGALLARMTAPGEKPAVPEKPTEVTPEIETAPPEAEPAPPLVEKKAPLEAPSPDEATSPPTEKPTPREPEPSKAPPSPRPSPAGRAKVSPVARRRAGELGIDPETLEGTGIDGSVSLADVELAASKGALAKAPSPAPTPDPAPGKRRAGFDPDQMRQAIAAAMSKSKREIPHYYLSSTIDMTTSLGWLEAYNRERGPEERLLPAVLLLKATALALRDQPQFNGFWEEGRFRQADGIHVGWAIALRGGGLIAPAIRDIDTLSLASLMEALRDLVGRARAGGIKGSEMMDPTFTVTSLGDRGAEFVLGVIYPPQVAILGFGRVIQRPWVVDGEIAPRPLLTASLAADHRASDGHAGGLFLSAIDRYLQEPDTL